jgi:hypothetical protein
VRRNVTVAVREFTFHHVNLSDRLSVGIQLGVVVHESILFFVPDQHRGVEFGFSDSPSVGVRVTESFRVLDCRDRHQGVVFFIFPD